MAFNNSRTHRIIPKHLRPRGRKDTTSVKPLRAEDELGIISTADSLKVRFIDKPGGKAVEIDLSYWLPNGELGLAVSHYFAEWGRNRSHGTRITFSRNLRKIWRYLCHLELKCGCRIEYISQLPESFLQLYANWLNDPTNTLSEKPYAKVTKSNSFNALKRMIAYWQTSKRFGGKINEEFHAKRNPWPGAHHHIKSTEILDPISYAKVRQAAIDEIMADAAKREELFNIISNNYSILPEVNNRSVVHFKNIEVKIKVIYEAFNGSHKGIDKKLHPGLHRSLKEPYGTVREVMERLHLSARQIVPYVVLLGMDTLFNAEGLLRLSWSDIREHPIFGSERWQINIQKDRGGLSDAGKPNIQSRSFATGLSSIDSVVKILLSLKRYTELTRRNVVEEEKDRVFLFFVAGKENFRSFRKGTTSTSCDSTWQNALRSFIDDNGLPEFSLRTLRATGGDLVYEITGDMKAQQVAMGHSSLGMTVRHYRASAAKQRDLEFLSQGIKWRERYVGTKGKSDTRNGGQSSGGYSAATPGFGCIDPNNPPSKFEVSGKLCAAFARCATCPLAFIDSDSAMSYARLIQFRDRLVEARVNVHPERYTRFLAPQLARLEQFWLPKYTQNARTGASLALPPFPELE